MKVSNWNWTSADRMVGKASLDRCRKAAEVIADDARRRCPAGTVSRPMYQSGPYAGQKWTARDAGQLKDSIRVVERDEAKSSNILAHFSSFGNYGNVRVYAGHFLAYYARIVEYFTPYLRPAVDATRSRVKDILENGGGYIFAQPTHRPATRTRSSQVKRRKATRMGKTGLPSIYDDPGYKAYLKRIRGG